PVYLILLLFPYTTLFRSAILPGWVEKIALAMPLTYWLELMRRALLGDAVGRAFPIASTPGVIGLLVLTTALAIVVCLAIFRVSEDRKSTRLNSSHQIISY